MLFCGDADFDLPGHGHAEVMGCAALGQLVIRLHLPPCHASALVSRGRGQTKPQC